jgi:hypothetical protein
MARHLGGRQTKAQHIHPVGRLRFVANKRHPILLVRNSTAGKINKEGNGDKSSVRNNDRMKPEENSFWICFFVSDFDIRYSDFLV